MRGRKTPLPSRAQPHSRPAATRHRLELRSLWARSAGRAPAARAQLPKQREKPGLGSQCLPNLLLLPPGLIKTMHMYSTSKTMDGETSSRIARLEMAWYELLCRLAPCSLDSYRWSHLSCHAKMTLANSVAIRSES